MVSAIAPCFIIFITSGSGLRLQDLAAAHLDLDPALRLAICAERALKSRSRWHGPLEIITVTALLFSLVF
jgi:hypothetical protein